MNQKIIAKEIPLESAKCHPALTVIATLIETAKLNGVDPQTWLTATLARLAAGHGARRLRELMPWYHPAAVA